MNSKLLKLDEPCKVIYAGGRIGRHIATPPSATTRRPSNSIPKPAMPAAG